MKTRNLLILAVLVAAAAAYILLFERHQATTEEVQQQADRVFPGLAADTVATIALTTPEGVMRFARDDEGWRLTEPLDVAADASAVDALLRAVMELDAERRFAADEVEPTAYGLDQPQYRVELTTADGELHQLAVGDEVPLGAKRAVSTAAPGVILCSGWFVNELAKELDEWRSRDVVEIYPADVVTVEVRAGDDHIQVAHIDERWQLLEPIDDLADRDHMRNLISDLNGMQVEEFVDDPAAAASLGLETPELKVTILRSEGRPPLSVSFGARRKVAGVAQVACRVDDHEIYWVKDPSSIRLAKAPVRWRSAVLAPFETWDVRAFSIRRGDSVRDLQRVDGLWQLADGSPADPVVVQDRLAALAVLEAVAFDLVTPEAAPIAELTVELEDGSDEPAAPIVYRFFPPMAAGGRYLAKVSNRDTVMSVHGAALHEIIDELDALAAELPVDGAAGELPEEIE